MKYWVYMNGEVPGSYAPTELAGLVGFSMTTLICPAEGEILEKNWRRAGEFEEVIKVLHERDAKLPPSGPRQAQEAVMTGDINALLDTASSRLFSHVSDLMKELENRREERALTVSLQRQLLDVKEQLRQARERSEHLETRMARIAELEEAARRDQAQIAKLESAVKAREQGMGEQRIQLEKLRLEFENAKRRLGESVNDLAIRNRLVDKLSRDLTEKELSLAKALGVIRRLEEDLNRLCPPPTPREAAPAKSEPPPALAPAPAAAPVAEALPPQGPAPLDAPEPPAEEGKPLPAIEPLPARPPLPPKSSTAAQEALVKRFRKLINKYEH